MPITLTCKCGKSIRARDELEGKKVRCPGCGAIVPVARDVPYAAMVEAPPQAIPLAIPLPKYDDGNETRPRDENSGCAASDRDVRSEARASGVLSWSFPNAAVGQNNFYALNKELLCFANLSTEGQREVQAKLDAGDDPRAVLTELATMVRLDRLTNVGTNHRGRDITIEYWKNRKLKKKKLTFPESDDREEVFQALKRELGDDWRSVKRDFSHLKQKLSAAGFLLMTILATIPLAIYADDIDENKDDQPRTRRARGLAVILKFIGRPGIIIVGLLVSLACVSWLVSLWLKPAPFMEELRPKSEDGRPPRTHEPGLDGAVGVEPQTDWLRKQGN